MLQFQDLHRHRPQQQPMVCLKQMVSLRAFHAHHFLLLVLASLCAICKCCSTYILTFAKWTLLKNVMQSHHLVILHTSHHPCVLKVVVKKRIAKTNAIHHAHVNIRNFPLLFVLDTLYRKVKRWFYKTLKMRVVISQSLEMGYNRTPEPERDVWIPRQFVFSMFRAVIPIMCWHISRATRSFFVCLQWWLAAFTNVTSSRFAINPDDASFRRCKSYLRWWVLHCNWCCWAHGTIFGSLLYNARWRFMQSKNGTRKNCLVLLF